MSRPTYKRARFLALPEGVEPGQDQMLASESWDSDEAMERAVTVTITYQDIARMIVDGKWIGTWSFAVTYDAESDEPEAVDKVQRVRLEHPLHWLRAQCESDESWLQVLNDITDRIVEIARAS